MEHAKVSIVIPVYNTEKYLSRCIKSLITQTYQNLELIFVDDGSRDNSYSILLAASEYDKRIKVFRQENAGVSAARNRGIEQSTGRYLMFCDSDDTVEPEWCETLVNTIEKYPDSWIVCEIQSLNEIGEVLYVNRHELSENILDKSKYYDLFIEGLSGCVYNKIFDAEKLKEKELRFDESKTRGEDVCFCLAYLDISRDIVVVKHVLYNYYHFENYETLTNKYHKDDWEVLRDLYVKRKKYISMNDMKKYQKHYWYLFCRELENTMLKCEESFEVRLKINHEIISTKEFQGLLKSNGKNDMNSVAFLFLRFRLYSGYLLVQKIYKLKIYVIQKYRRKVKGK